MSQRGRFIVFEGLDGSGTTTQVSSAVRYLFEKDKKNDILQTREPTKHSQYGIELRARLTNSWDGADPERELG